MKKIVKGLSLLLAAVTLIGAAGCGTKGSTDPVKPVVPDEEPGYFRDMQVKSVVGIEFLTGRRFYTNSEGKRVPYTAYNFVNFTDNDVGGTDLGVPFYNSKNDTMYFLFGDTYGASGGNWRSSVMGITKDFDASDGIHFDSWWRPKNCAYKSAQAVIEGKHLPTDDCVANGYERTKIPQGGIEVNGTVYIFYESIRNFGAAGTWRVNYQGAIKSTDNCETFERVYDLTWFNSVTNKFDYAIRSAEQSWEDATTPVNLSAPVEGKIERAEEREAPYFSQCYPVDGKDGYVYLFGRKSGRQHGVKVARVAYENIEVFSEYEYYLGTDYNDDPVWEKGYSGLKKLNNDNTGYILETNEDEPSSNMTIMWNEYLKKWMFVYFRPASARVNSSIGYRLSDTVWGNYGEFHEVLEQDFFSPDGSGTGVRHVIADLSCTKEFTFYGGFCHEKWQERDGQVFYFVATVGGIYNSALFKVTLN